MSFTTRLAALLAVSATLVLPLASHPAVADTAASTPPAAAPPPQPIVPPTHADKAMVTRALAVAKLDPGTPGVEAEMFLMNEWPHFALDELSGKTPATAAQLAGARAIVTGLLTPMELGPTWPMPSLTHIPHTSGAITIDGKLDSPGWKGALTYHGDYEYNTKVHVDSPATTIHVAWDEKNLYFAFDCADTDIVAPPLARDKNPFDYDAVEMFILPTYDPPIYWEVVVGPQGAIFDGLHTKNTKGWGPIHAAVPDEVANIAGLQTAEAIRTDPVSGADIGYTIEVAVPFDQLPTYAGRTPHAGDKLYLMLSRMDKHKPGPDGKTAAQQYYSAVPLLSWGHNIWNYIPVVLEPAGYQGK